MAVIKRFTGRPRWRTSSCWVVCSVYGEQDAGDEGNKGPLTMGLFDSFYAELTCPNCGCQATVEAQTKDFESASCHSEP